MPIPNSEEPNEILSRFESLAFPHPAAVGEGCRHRWLWTSMGPLTLALLMQSLGAVGPCERAGHSAVVSSRKCVLYIVTSAVDTTRSDDRTPFRKKALARMLCARASQHVAMSKVCYTSKGASVWCAVAFAAGTCNVRRRPAEISRPCAAEPYMNNLPQGPRSSPRDRVYFAAHISSVLGRAFPAFATV